MSSKPALIFGQKKPVRKCLGVYVFRRVFKSFNKKKNPSFHLSWVEKQFILIVKHLDNLQWFKEVRKDLLYFCHVKNNYHGVVESSRYILLHKTHTFTKQNDHCINWFSVGAIKYQDKITQGRKSLFQFTVPEGWSPP